MELALIVMPQRGQVLQEDPVEDLEALIQQELDQQEAQEILPLQTHHKVMLVVQVLRMVVVKKQVTDKVAAVAVVELRVEIQALVQQAV